MKDHLTIRTEASRLWQGFASVLFRCFRWGSKNHHLFIAECDHRIDSRRPPRGNVAGSERDAPGSDPRMSGKRSHGCSCGATACSNFEQLP